MPIAREILAAQMEIAERCIAVAIAWHVVIAAAILAFALGWRPSRVAARRLIALPIASAAVLAFAFGNPFNGLVLGAGALALIALARGTGRVERGPWWQWGAGA